MRKKLFAPKYSLKSENKTDYFITWLFIAYFGFWWLYKLAILPGLHGEERVLA